MENLSNRNLFHHRVRSRGITTLYEPQCLSPSRGGVATPFLVLLSLTGDSTGQLHFFHLKVELLEYLFYIRVAFSILIYFESVGHFCKVEKAPPYTRDYFILEIYYPNFLSHVQCTVPDCCKVLCRPAKKKSGFFYGGLWNARFRTEQLIFE